VNCAAVRSLAHAYLDGELDLVHQVEIDQHLRECDACARFYESQRALKTVVATDAMRLTPPPQLQDRVQHAIRRRRSIAPQWIGLAAAAVAIVIVTALLSRGSERNAIGQEVASAHIRSLMAHHLTDVASSDQHTVKPWFTGKLPFSPPVSDFKSEGFPLVGARLDYIDSRPVAALVYQHGQHVINLFEWPSSNANANASEKVETREGYNVLSWSRDRMNYEAVSDLNVAELRQFAQLVRGAR